jgi:hypothetical protein
VLGAARPTGGIVTDNVSNTEARHNLPEQLTSFIGRQVESAEVMAMIAKHRLVTLAGTGGVGKTRLAVRGGTSTRDTPDAYCAARIWQRDR